MIGGGHAPRRLWPYAAVAAVTALAFVRGPFSGHPLYFRDLSLYFFPLRRFVLGGLAEGKLHFWNPYVHEGQPLALPPISYPFDLLQLLRPDEVGISFVLALHVPLAALFMMALARHGLGLSSTAAAGAALVYALGGFALSTLNLYVYAHALAWAPAAILGLLLASRGDRRAIALGGMAVGVLVSTTAAEMVAQAIAIAILLALPCSPAALGRMALALLLGAAMAAPSLAVMARITADSARAAGLPPEVVLSHSIHPLTLFQVVVAGFYGDTARITERWWGENFFPRGFPYFLSLYLGLATLVTAGVGAAGDRGPRRRLVAIAVVAVLLALGPWGLGAGAVEGLDLVRRFRYPSKLFFASHLAVALLVSLGVEALASGSVRAWRRLSVGALAAGVLAGSAPLLPLLAPGYARWFASGFFPPDRPWDRRIASLDWMLGDAAMGGAVAAAAGGLAILAWRGRVPARPAALGVVALLAADLMRGGAGLNPATVPAFFSPSPEVARHHATWREAGRVFTCYPSASRAYLPARAMRPDHERWTFALLRDTASPWFNVSAALPTALSPDLTSLVAPERLVPAGAGCESVDRLIAPMREAAVGHVISIDPLSHPDLILQAQEQPPSLEPVTIFVYALRDPLPMISLSGPIPATDATVELQRHDPGHIEVRARSPVAARLVVREARAQGWTASIDGAPVAFVAADRGHLAVMVPPGTHTVRLDYTPPGFRVGVLIALAGGLVILGLLLAPRRRPSAS